MYGYEPSDKSGLNIIRYLCFKKRVLSDMDIACKLSGLPPTAEALQYHSLRVYLQIQKWLGNSDKSPLEYGWELIEEQGLLPITMKNDPLPDYLVRNVKCACKKGCKTGNCSCRAKGKFCSSMCRFCRGTNCTNNEQPGDLETVEENEENKEDSEQGDISILESESESSLQFIEHFYRDQYDQEEEEDAIFSDGTTDASVDDEEGPPDNKRIRRN